jgi:uncharacterized protein (TIGR00290 family)
VPKAIVFWSGGKDSAWALRSAVDFDVAALVTTTNECTGRIAMHAVRRELLEAQAAAIGLPLWTVPLPWPCPNDRYQRILSGIYEGAVRLGVEAVIFGDLYLEDIRAYREQCLDGTGLKPVFPLWRLPTDALAREMIDAGIRAKIACVDPKMLGRDLAGREFDRAFLADLPAGVDPCGERGEFHSFVYDGPMFRRPVPVSVGEIRDEDGFVFAELQWPASFL